MVQVRQQTLIDAQGAIDLDRWLMQMPMVLEDQDQRRLLDGVLLLQQAQQQLAEDVGDWARESNCVIAGLDIAIILADLHVDPDCLLAGHRAGAFIGSFYPFVGHVSLPGLKSGIMDQTADFSLG